jgi:GntR family transcriptional repressor for pyruvate dehydrogenase complex
MPEVLRRAPLVESNCARLRQDYAGAEWLPPERELSGRLGVSRPALREAIKRLEIEGLLASRHGVGVEVVDRPHAPVQSALERLLPAPADRLRQFTAARRVIEPELAALAAAHARPSDRRDLQAAHARFVAAAATPGPAVAADLDFHRAIARASGNQVLALMIASMSPLEADSRRVTLGQVGHATAARQHARILEAITAGDGPAARGAMLAHLEAALRSLSPSPSR